MPESRRHRPVAALALALIAASTTAVAAPVALLALTPASAHAQPQQGAAPPATKVDDPATLTRHLFPLAPAMAATPEVVVDTSDFPQGAAWAARAKVVVEEWFPIVWRLLGTEGRTPPRRINLVFKKKIDAPAYAGGDTITVNGEWITRAPDDFGMMVHELTHLIQAYSRPGERPGWLVEGIADYIRWWRYEPETPRTRIDPAKASYRDAYRTTAAFLAYLTARYDRRLVARLDKALRDGTYSSKIFSDATGGRDLDALWAEFIERGGPSYGLPAAPPRTSAAAAAGAPSASALPTPPETWTEHWFEHKQTVKRVAYNDDIAVYIDDDTNRAKVEEMVPALTALWRYTKQTYGAFGPEGRLYYLFHEKKYGGGHPSTYFDASHDGRNVSDCGPGPWGLTALDMPTHEVGHVVEGANNGIHGSPAFPVWGDSKWIEFYQYDAYKATGMEADAKRVFDKFSATTDNFPRPGTHWFRDWFYPLWRDHGGGPVMARFFALTAKHFPTQPENGGKNRKYSRDMNWGEYLHFMSGAAGTDLRPLALKAFGPSAERDAQFAKARTDFPGITYK
jgi:Plant Basic Secretory Protein.